MQEAIPFLSDAKTDPYDRFSAVQKKIIVAVVASAGLIAPFVGGSFVPCIPAVAKDLNTTGEVVNFIVGIYLSVLSFSGFIWAPYSGFYGRRPIYLISLPLMCLGSLAVTLSTSVTQLAMGRTLQAFGASSFMSVGPSSISDIYRLEERGTGMGIYFAAVLLGPALAPMAGGLTATYASWRAMQMILFGMSLASLIAVIFFLPETCHPGTKGIDKMRGEEERAGGTFRARWVWLNPFSCLKLLPGPNVAFVALTTTCALITDYVMLIPMSYTIGSRYGLKSPALIGACFLPSGLGNAVGSPIAGRLSDKFIIEKRKQREGKWIPEDRLLAAIPGAVFLVPVSVLIYGLTVQFIPDTVGLIICLFCLFMNGVGLIMVLGPCGTYGVDILRTQSAEVIAVLAGTRNFFAGQTAAAVLPMMDRVGVAITCAISAIIAWVGSVLLLVTILYGTRLRKWVDLDYTVSEI